MLNTRVLQLFVQQILPNLQNLGVILCRPLGGLGLALWGSANPPPGRGEHHAQVPHPAAGKASSGMGGIMQEREVAASPEHRQGPSGLQRALPDVNAGRQD